MVIWLIKLCFYKMIIYFLIDLLDIPKIFRDYQIVKFWVVS
jgi:hypothetical protein